MKLQWNQIDWTRAEESVNRLQIRIAKATLEQKWRLVKRFRYLMTRRTEFRLAFVNIEVLKMPENAHLVYLAEKTRHNEYWKEILKVALIKSVTSG